MDQDLVRSLVKTYVALTQRLLVCLVYNLSTEKFQEVLLFKTLRKLS